MAGIRFTKAERQLIRSAIEALSHTKVTESILEKLDRSEVTPKKKREGMSVAAAIEAFRGVLGSRLVLPPNPSAGWYAMQSAQLTRLGMTPDLCRAVAMQAGSIWQGNIKAESIIRQADRLLHDYVENGAGGTDRVLFSDLADEDL